MTSDESQHCNARAGKAASSCKPRALRHRCAHVMLLCLVLGSGQAAAYSIFPYGIDQALKWGDNTVGTPGGVVTWSLMADGITLDPSAAALGFSGSSTLSSVFAQVGGQAPALAAMQAAFDAWSAVANIQFQQVSETGALPFGANYGGAPVVGHIRIGAFAIAGTVGAVGYAPPPNGGTTLEGDIIFNASNSFGLPLGNEGDLYELFPASNNFLYLNDFAGLFSHELGHALGLGHSEIASALMCGYTSSAFDGSLCDWADPDGDGMAPIARLPKLDDMQGIGLLYGPAPPVPEPATWMLWLSAGAAWLLRGLSRTPASAQ